MAAEILERCAARVGALHLVPVTDGRFELEVDGSRVFDNAKEGRFPDRGEALRLVLDRLDGR